MLEQVFPLSTESGVERVVQNEALHYIHMVFAEGEGLPEHLSNSTLYMTVLRGQLSIRLADQPVHVYPAGTLLQIPIQIRMLVRNLHAETLELLVIKAPPPSV